MHKIYVYKTTLNGRTIYSLNPNKEHPQMRGEYPDEIKMTKKNMVKYILSEQEGPIWTKRELMAKLMAISKKDIISMINLHRNVK